MKDDIRVIKQVGIITSGEGNWQKELNIVSVNNGPSRYDIREWAKDHSSFGDGISFENEEAQTLLSILYECFENCGEDNAAQSSPDAAGEGHWRSEQPDSAVNKTTLSDEVFCALLKDRGLDVTDKRDKGGALWVVGGHELDAVMAALGELGYIFLYSEKGGRSTKGKPGWYHRTDR